MSNREEKAFKTFEEQIEGLKRKKLKFKNERFALNILKRVNYYSFINAKYIFIAESNIKTKLSYYFCEKYKTDNNAYRDVNNFNYITELRITIDNLVQKLKKTIRKQSNIQGSRINHYTTNYNTVPLWVLMPQLDFGTTAYFFKCSKKDIQSKIAKNMKFEFIEENSEFNNEYIFTGEALSNIIFFVNSFRNICAHNERLYDHRFISNNIKNFIVHEHYRLNFNYGLFDLILVLKFFISPSEFPRNWEEILEIKEDLQKAKEFYQN